MVALVSSLLDSAARTASSTQVIDLDNSISGDVFAFQVDCTAASGTTPTLDVYVQTSFDAGASWVDVAAFPQLTAAAKRIIVLPKLAVSAINLAAAVITPTDGSLAASSALVIPMTDHLRLKWTVGGGTPSFTFSVRSFAR